MADILSFNLTPNGITCAKEDDFSRSEYEVKVFCSLSTAESPCTELLLRFMGVDVVSFGEFFETKDHHKNASGDSGIRHKVTRPSPTTRRDPCGHKWGYFPYTTPSCGHSTKPERADQMMPGATTTTCSVRLTRSIFSWWMGSTFSEG